MAKHANQLHKEKTYGLVEGIENWVDAKSLLEKLKLGATTNKERSSVQLILELK